MNRAETMGHHPPKADTNNAKKLSSIKVKFSVGEKYWEGPTSTLFETEARCSRYHAGILAQSAFILLETEKKNMTLLL